VKSGTRLSEIIGARHGGVQSSHHQGVGSVGEGLVETAWAEDGSLEGLEDPDHRLAVGVLWHPEMEEDKRLFVALVAEARRYREERAPASPKPGTVTDFSRTPSPRAVREVAD
jgi:gamma-glutamyl-gamma-aminobutyrate hydrolase PuuD